MYVELTLQLDNTDFVADFGDETKRFLKICNNGDGLVIGAINQEDDLLGGCFETISDVKEIEALRDFLNYMYPKGKD